MPKVVEEVFVREGLVVEVQVRGVRIRTTAEHPLYRLGDGWTAAQELRAGDQVRLEDGWASVDAVIDTGSWETVYNFRVNEYHTYFVGGDHWGWAVWAHNTVGCAWDEFRAVLKDRGLDPASLSAAYQAAKANDGVLFRSLLAPQKLPLDVLQRSFKIGSGAAAEALAELQAVTTAVRKALASDVSLAGNVLSIGEQMALLNAKGQRRKEHLVMTYGKVIERLAAGEILANPRLDALFRHVGGKSMPDFVGKGKYAGLNFDITTVLGIPAHIARPVYGPGLQIATYKAAPKKWP